MPYRVPVYIRAFTAALALSACVLGFYVYGGWLTLVLVISAAIFRLWAPPAVFLQIAEKLRVTKPAHPIKAGYALESLSSMSTDVGVSCPKLFLTDRTQIEAHAMTSEGGAAIIVSRGFLSLSESEQDAVLAHELAHIFNRDIYYVWAIGVAAAAMLLSTLLLLFGAEAPMNRMALDLQFSITMASIGSACFTGFILLNGWLKRRLEWQADDMSVQLTKKRRPLIDALRQRMSEVNDKTRTALINERIVRLSSSKYH